MGREKELEAAPEKQNTRSYGFHLPRSLNIDEKKYLLSVERGDLPNVRRILQAANRPSPSRKIDVNCLDSLGRGAMTLAIESENLEMVELLIVMGVEPKDSLLHAINQEFVEAVELLLEHEELMRDVEIESAAANGVSCDASDVKHSWQKVDSSLARYPPEMTPLMLAAHKDNYEILKLLLDRGATLPMPHDVKCGCEDCVRAAADDPLRLSSTRIAEYRALASPSLIALSSPDPLMTAFQLSWELRELANAEPESCGEYRKLRKQVQKFSVDLLEQTRSSSELNTILNYDPEDRSVVPTKRLARLEQALRFKQKEFIVHPHVQQLLSAIWYEGVPGFRRMSAAKQAYILLETALLTPLYCAIYLLFPNTKMGQTLRRPFMKFLVHASSYVGFLLLLILVSQRLEEEIVMWLDTDDQDIPQAQGLTPQRGLGPSFLECLVMVYVVGYVLEETREVYVYGFKAYLRDLWNFIDFTRNSLYVAVAILRVAAYAQQRAEISEDPSAGLIARENWPDFDPQLVAEGLFAAANIFSALKLVHLFSINPHLGPLQISLGRMIFDIIKFFFVYTLVLFAFACGLNQLLWYFAELEKKKCYRDLGDAAWDSGSDSCIRWRRFSSLFESCQSLFWATFGSIGLDSFELSGIKSYTRFWGLLMFGSYSTINVIVLLNMLIAMMSNSWLNIKNHADTEWKFARTKLWVSYFEEGATLPPPFNVFPRPKFLLKLCCLVRKKKNLQSSVAKRDREHKHSCVMKALIWRYVVNAHSEHEMQPVTEDDISELKTDFSAWRCELLEILKKNGMDTSSADTTEKIVHGRKMKVWERRLVKDFKVSSPADDPLEEIEFLQRVPDNEDFVAKWKRIARLAVLKSAEYRWAQVIDNTVKKSQIGRCNDKRALKQQESLKKVMEEARRLSLTDEPSPILPIKLPEPINPNKILRIFKDEPATRSLSPSPNRPKQALSPSKIETKTVQSTGTINYENESSDRGKSPRPLVSLRVAAPKVIKRKYQAPTAAAAAPPSSNSPAYLEVPAKTKAKSTNFISELVDSSTSLVAERSKSRSPSPRNRSPIGFRNWL